MGIVVSTFDQSEKGAARRKVIFCTPCLVRPHQAYLDSMAASVPLLDAAGWDHGAVFEVGNPYISCARAFLLRKALDAKADAVVFIDYDLSWRPGDLLKVIEAEGEVIAGTYRFKRDPEEYMGALLPGLDGTPQVRGDGCVKAHSVPAGFLKITRAGVNRFMAAYPELLYGERQAPHVDLFNHGAHEFVWVGEDFRFCQRWLAKCGEIWCVPDLQLDHHAGDVAYPGNFHRYLMAQPGGSDDPDRPA